MSPSMIRRSVTIAAVILAPSALLATAPAASAAPTCTVTVPSRVSVRGATTNFTATFSSGCAGVTEADWQVTRGSAVFDSTLLYHAGDGFSHVFAWDDTRARGLITWKPDGVDYVTKAPIVQNTPTTDFRLGTNAYLVMNRYGSKVYSYTRTTRYNQSTHSFTGYVPSTRARLERQSSTGTWSAIKYLYPDSNGVYRYNFTAASAASYRVHVLDYTQSLTSTSAVQTYSTWGSVSTTVRK